MDIPLYKCARCGKLLAPGKEHTHRHYPKKHFCDVNCAKYYVSSKNGVKVTCKICGTTFMVDKSRLKYQRTFRCPDCIRSGEPRNMTWYRPTTLENKFLQGGDNTCLEDPLVIGGSFNSEY